MEKLEDTKIIFLLVVFDAEAFPDRQVKFSSNFCFVFHIFRALRFLGVCAFFQLHYFVYLVWYGKFQVLSWVKTFAWRMKTALITLGFFLLLIHKAVSSGLGAGCLQVGWEDGVNLSYCYEFSFV